MKTCFFCSNKAGRKEHIVADWLIKRMKAEDMPISIAHRNEKGFKVLRTHKLSTYKVSCVCDACNNGWMSQLENWFKQDMGMLVEPDWPKLSGSLASEDRPENLSARTKGPSFHCQHLAEMPAFD